MNSAIKACYLKYSRPILFVIYFVSGLYFRYAEFNSRELGVDEINQINHTLGPFKPIWQRLPNGELTCFPGEYIITYPFVQIFHPSKWGIAIPNIISAVIGFFVLYLICMKYFKTLFAFVITFTIYSFNHSLVYHAFEIRPYAILPTLALTVFYFSDQIVNQYGVLSKSRKFFIGLFFISVVIYHAYGSMILFFGMLFFVLARTETASFKEVFQELRPFVSRLAIVTIPIFIWYASGYPDFNYEQSVVERGINTFDYIPNPLDDLRRFLRTVMNCLIGFKKFKFKHIVNGVILALLIPHKERTRQIGFLLILVVLPIEIMLLGDLHKGYWFLSRQFICIMPLYAFFLGWCWDTVIVTILKRIRSVKGKRLGGGNS